MDERGYLEIRMQREDTRPKPPYGRVKKLHQRLNEGGCHEAAADEFEDGAG